MQEDEGRESGLSTSTLNTATANSDQVVRGMVNVHQFVRFQDETKKWYYRKCQSQDN